MQEILNALPAGYTLHEYRIEAMLGAGGFGLTYLAHDGNLNTKVAIKEYLPADFAERGADQSVQPKSASAQQSFEWGLSRFLDESRTLASFRHPNIVRVMRFIEANRTAYMVMEFVAGKPLNEWVMENRTLDQSVLSGIALPLLEGLEVIHQAGYLHRDIKPSNIFIREDGNPVLIDFGSARAKADPDKDLTAIVTPGFAPLEQYHAHGKQGPWTDIYSLAGVLYWLVMRRKPLDAAARVRSDTMPSALDNGERRHFSAGFLEAIDWGLRTHEEDRPQSVVEWRAALSGCSIDAAAAGAIGGPLPEPPAAVEPVSSTAMPPGIAIDRDTLKRFETEFAKYLGPIAGVMVRNAAKKAASAQELAALLAPEIADGEARAAFVRKLSGDESMLPSQSRQNLQADSAVTRPSEKISTSALQRFGEETLRSAETALARHIGAVARVMVKRAANKARDESELYLLLAEEIEDKTEKKNFIRKAISVSGKV